MYRFTVSNFNGIYYTLTDCWMWMYTIEYFLISGLQFTTNNRFNDDFCNIVPYHMRTQPLSVFCIKDHLDKSFGMAGCRSFPGSTQREFPDLDFITGILCLFFRVPDGSNFRRTISTSRHIIVVDGFRRMSPFFFEEGYIFNTYNSLFGCHMGQCLTGCTISY